MIKALLPAILLILALCSCHSRKTAESTPEETISATYDCSGGETISVHFLPRNKTAIITRNGEHLTLPEQVSGSGFIYSDSQTTIRGKGNMLMIESEKAPTLSCQAR